MKYHDELLELLRKTVGDIPVQEEKEFSAKDLKSVLPAATFSAFEFDAVNVFDSRVMFARPIDSMKPAALIAQLKHVSQACSREVACYLDTPTAYQKTVLIEGGVGFLSANGEFFLPMFLHLKPAREERAPSLASELTTTGKSVYLYLLYAESGSTVSEMAEHLMLSRAGVQRACEDLLARGLVVRSMGGPTKRTAIYELVDNFELGWESFGPAARRVRIVPLDSVQNLPVCGLSALAERTILNPPEVPEYAVHLKQESELANDALGIDDKMAVVHVLPYDPTPFVHDGIVDPFTMLKTVSRHDERIDMAIDTIKENMGWPI